MTILIYEYHELEERTSKNLSAWKACHIVLYVLAAIFGVLNYTFLFQTEELVNRQCIFYPRLMAFHWVQVPNYENMTTIDEKNDINGETAADSAQITVNTTEDSVRIAQTTVSTTEKAKVGKREAPNEFITTDEEITVDEQNGTMITENKTHRYMLNPNRTLFPKDTDSGCQFAEYMPLLSAAFAIVWTTLFIMCPSGGRSQSRTGLTEPWRILMPAFIFALVMVILTGYSFTSTNGGLQAFCIAFQNYTNSTACSSVNPFIELSSNSSWQAGGRIAATRAASAGVWASWSCACALLLARCLTAADFQVKRTAVHLVKDPQQKVTPYLKKQNSPRRSQRSTQNSPSKRDAVSVRSEPTATTELVTASVEHNVENESDSLPTSLTVTPQRERHARGEELEMTYNPQERFIE